MKAYSWLWLLVPALGLVEFAAHAHFRDAAPTAEEWRAVEPQLRALVQDGDLIVAAPYWADPHLRSVVGDDLISLRDAARPDDSAYKRAVVVSILGETPKLDAAGHGAPWRRWWRDRKGDNQREEDAWVPWQVEGSSQHGKFELQVLTNPRYEPVLLDLVDAFGPDTVRVRARRNGKGKGRSKECRYNSKAKTRNGALHGHPTFPRQRFECGGGNWHFAGVTVIEDQNYRPRRCIWAHPAQGKRLSVRFNKVKLGSRLTGYGGLPWFLERESHGTPIELEVRVGTEKAGTYRHKDGEGWKPFTVDTSPWEGEELSVEFRIRSQRARSREFCFQADIR